MASKEPEEGVFVGFTSSYSSELKSRATSRRRLTLEVTQELCRTLVMEPRTRCIDCRERFQKYVNSASCDEDVTCMLLDCRDHKYAEMALLEIPDVFGARWLVHDDPRGLCRTLVWELVLIVQFSQK
ncbi:hypothetical protein Bca52824_024697 [Brassica carinata]|uniref:Uncharacterized protein n=1 Tax=Brassica carinata TaxID=52824 RepID=A0A8X7VLM7_BRACI|nr:hypothetical protein Bca52824_024697 [Brassica carinata]